MAVSYFFGETMVGTDEIAEKSSMGMFSKFNKSVSKGLDDTIKFRDGIVNTSEVNNNSNLDLPDRIPIGVGKPLCMEILCLYTGDVPGGIFNRKKDLLVVSGVRATSTHDEAPRAINQLVKKIEDNQYIQPSAFAQGSPIIYYTTAVDVSTVLCSIEMIVDSFPEQTFNNISGLLEKTAGIPLFFTKSMYLLAGSTIIKMAGELGKALFESQPFMKDNIPLYFDDPNMPIANARLALIHNENEAHLLQEFIPGFINTAGEIRRALVHKVTKEEYKGKAPYILLSIDGRNKDHELSKFTPKLATAAILEKFYGSNVETKSIEILETAMLLYNDLNYFNKAKKLEEDLKNITPNSTEYKKAKELLAAYKANIQNEQFKL
jgi:hypothetical protein